MRRRWHVSVAGAMGAVALHVLFLSALTLGAKAGKPLRRKTGDPQIQLPRTDQGAVSAIIFMDPTVLSEEADLKAPDQLRPLSPKTLHRPRLVRLAAPHLGYWGDSDDRESQGGMSTAALDGPERAVLFGRYVNQIAARVERDWVRPSVAPSGTTLWGRVSSSASAAGPAERSLGAAAPAQFKCRVQILQSRSGEVLEVTLLSCDSSPEWQQALVNAIDAASPLPSPPNESVFARSVVLNFTSAASLSGSAQRPGGVGVVR